MSRGLAAAGSVVFVLVLVLVAASGERGAELGVWRFLLIAIALFAFAYGLRAGIVVAAVSILVSAAWHVAGGTDAGGWLSVSLRSLNYVLAGVIVGWLVDSRGRALVALARHVELSSDVIVSGAGGRFEDVNAGFTRALGYPVEDVVGRLYLEFVHPDDRDRSIAVERELEAGGGPIPAFENRYRHKDGSYRWLEWSINVDPSLGKGFAVGRDVTERKQAERREREMLDDLHESLRRGKELERQLTTVVETMGDGLIEVDAAGRIVLFNRAAEGMFGYSRDEVLGTNVSVLMPDPYVDEHNRCMERFHTGGEARMIGIGREVAGRRKDGTVFPLDLSVSETIVDDRRLFVGVIRDITDRKRADQRAQHHREALERAVHERTRELQERTAALEESRLDTLQRLALAGEYHDEDTHLHTERVGASAALIAHVYGSTRDFVELIRLAAPLHDLGKLAVPDSILLKRGPLTEKQWEQVRSHPIVGAAILAGSTSEVLQLAEEIALSHHEWWDGSGYPVGLGGARIPLSGRIVTLADTFDALTHDRPYKPAWTIDRAIAEIQRLRGTKFDPEIIDAFDQLDPGQLIREPVPSAPAVPPHIRRQPAALRLLRSRTESATSA